MALIMGIDTGGTYTDGVIVDPTCKRVLCKAKTFTTKHDLMAGISKCMDQLNDRDVKKVGLVCLSTTLATNAIVEGRGGKAGLLIIGKEPEDKLPVESWQLLRGKLDIKGNVKEDLQEDEIYEAIENLRDKVDAVAISGYASVRNSTHELKVKQMVHEQLDIPVVCAHELTSSLGFHHRTVTAALNAKLIPIIRELINATKDVLRKNNIEVPIMMVKGDGSLMQESSAIDKPIETILSGPAASIKGGIFLTNQEEALILDMGGTTTDIAHVESGRVKIKEKGASVGGWLTRVKAAEISTFGIGGDSYLHFNTDGKLKIGPQRVQPLCVAGKNDPKLINELKTIRKDEKYELFSDQEIDCFSINKKPKKGELNRLDEKILQLLEDGPHSLFYLARSLEKDAEALELSRLVSENILTRISMTPTDILHALGRFKLWDEKISLVAVEILADRMGKTISELLEMAVSQITNQLTIACLQSITNFEEQSFNLKNNDAAMYLINKAGKLETPDLLMTQFIVSKPIVAIGAPVNAWVPQVCKMLNTKLMIPEHAEVANAIGAAVGQIMETADVLIRPDRKHKKYILHAPWGRDVFDTLNDAMDYAVPAIKKYVADLMMHAGSEQFDIVESHEDIFVDIIGTNKKTYVETRIKATGIGSPMWIQNK